MDTPLYKKFHPGQIKDLQDRKKQVIFDFDKDWRLLLIERNFEIFDIALFLTSPDKKFEEKKMLMLLGNNETGNCEIAVFAAQYCLERNTIEAAICLDFSKLKLQDMIDKLNLMLNLNVSISPSRTYFERLLDKINEKYNQKPVVIIVDNLI